MEPAQCDWLTLCASSTDRYQTIYSTEHNLITSALRQIFLLLWLFCIPAHPQTYRTSLVFLTAYRTISTWLITNQRITCKNCGSVCSKKYMRKCCEWNFRTSYIGCLRGFFTLFSFVLWILVLFLAHLFVPFLAMKCSPLNKSKLQIFLQIIGIKYSEIVTTALHWVNVVSDINPDTHPQTRSLLLPLSPAKLILRL